MTRFALSFAFVVLGVLVACGDDDVPTVDAGPVDMYLPPGPQGDVLRVPESMRRVIPALEGEVYVLRTEGDVPHIYASNERDLRIVQGFVVARDRYFQIEAGRRLAQGRLSELVGEAGLAGDQGSRGRGMSRVATRLLEQLTPEQEALVDAYVEGVNAYIRAVKERMAPAPSELQVAAPVLGAGTNPGNLMEELTRADLIAFAAVPVYQLGFEASDPIWQSDSEEVAGAFAGDPLRAAGVQEDIWANVEPLNPVSSAAGFGLERGSTPLRLPGGAPGRAEVPLPTLASARVEHGMLDRLVARNDAFLTTLRGAPGEDFGSNAWATVGAHSEGGAAILSGDGHLPLSIAPLFFQLGLDTSVFGGGDTTLMGLFFAGIPPMAVGTNGRIAWSQTYLRGDVTDWYAEEVVLGTDGMPSASVFDGAEEPLRIIEESYEVADIPGLSSVGRTETWARFETFDGRVIAAIEGRPATAATVPGVGEALINVQGEYVIPDDVDDDGVISAISFDYVAFDVSNLLRALQGFNDSNTVGEFREATRELVTYAQNLVAADTAGDVYYGSYNAMPSRAHLPRDPEGRWVAGANPRGLIDGTTYPGFTVPLDADGFPDESACDEATAPERCLIPFDQWPSALSPDKGFVLTANNDIANITTDGDFFDDPFYIGGPWNNGFRGQTIQDRLLELVADDSASLAAMQALQANHDSVLGRRFARHLLEAIDEAQRLAAEGTTTDDEARLLAAYEGEAAALDELETRLGDWLGRGAIAKSGVETFYATPTATDREDAVATMLFNEWWRQAVDAIFGDEDMGYAFGVDPSTATTRAMADVLEGRGAGNPRGLASFEAAAEESIFFDDLGTAAVRERSDEVLVTAAVSALARLREAPTEPGVGGFGTDDMSQWLWGLRHLVIFESIITQFVGDDPTFALLANGFSITPGVLPLAEDLPDGDPRADLPWFPRPGDLFNVDAGHWSLGRGDYFYGNGPVMRMVIRLEDGNISGFNVIPGGQSGRKDSDHFADQAALWLGNETVPLRFHVEDVVAGATTRETFAPE